MKSIIYLSIIPLILGCVGLINPASSAELHSIHGHHIYLKKYHIKNPKNKIVIIFNHGTSNWKRVSKCRPEKNPVVLEWLEEERFNGKSVLPFHLCSFSVGSYANELTIIRAQEINRAVEYFVKNGVKPRNIFIFGQSRGGVSTLYFAATNKKYDIGGIVVFNPSMCSRTYQACAVDI